MGLLLIKAFKPSVNSNRWEISTGIRRSRTPREYRHESGEAMSARRSERPQKGRRR
nr:hypothetical protein [Tanacetum cinerariifolium]